MTTPVSPDWVQRDLPRLPEKERHRNPPRTFESSFSNTLSKDFTNGDKPPLCFPSLVCCCFVPARRKVGRGKGDGGGERRRGEKLLALPGSEWPFIKGGLFLKRQWTGGKEAKMLSFPKRVWTGTSVSLSGTTENATKNLEKITYIALDLKKWTKKRSLLERQ